MYGSRGGYSIPVNASLLIHSGLARKFRPLFRKAFFLPCCCVVLILSNWSPVRDGKSRDVRSFGQHSNGERSDTHSTWRAYGGAADGAQYSSLHQIDRSNVHKLNKVWSYQTGDGLPYAFNPVVVDNVMYVMARTNSIVALDATTGKEIWIHPTGAKTSLITNRGIDYWESADRSERRLLFAADNHLQAIDARTGHTIIDFGEGGRTDLREGLGRDPKTLTLVQSTNPGRIFEDLLILGSATNEEYDSGPGDIRAYSVRTGKLVWSFHTIPHPGEPGYETWPKGAWKTVGGANAWSGMALDSNRGVVYVPTASPKYNFYGANRYGNCLLAINAHTGKLLWYYQMVHHDIWDYDNAGTPMLTTVRHDGKLLNVVAQVNKVGFVWVFDRDTGKPLWPIEERAVPKSDMPGEETWPTQPFPSKPAPFARQRFTVDDLSPYLEPEERVRLQTQILKARNRGLFEPPSTEDTIEMPGNNGGANFGGSAVDPKHGYLYVISKDLPAILKLSLADPLSLPSHAGSANLSAAHYKSGFGFMFANSGLSVIAPPWTTLTAYDLNSGEIRWQIPLGEVPELAARGITDTGSHFPKVNPVLTVSGLIFTGTRDRKVRALDSATGKVLWEATVDAALEGMPAVYEQAGREYVVFCAASRASTHLHAADPDASADRIQSAYVAFAIQ